MRNRNLLIGAIVIGGIALYLYRRNKQKAGETLSITDVADITTTRPEVIEGETVVVESRASYVDCYTDSFGRRCCRDKRTGDIICGGNLTR